MNVGRVRQLLGQAGILTGPNYQPSSDQTYRLDQLWVVTTPAELEKRLIRSHCWTATGRVRRGPGIPSRTNRLGKLEATLITTCDFKTYNSVSLLGRRIRLKTSPHRRAGSSHRPNVKFVPHLRTRRSDGYISCWGNSTWLASVTYWWHSSRQLLQVDGSMGHALPQSRTMPTLDVTHSVSEDQLQGTAETIFDEL